MVVGGAGRCCATSWRLGWSTGVEGKGWGVSRCENGQIGKCRYLRMEDGDGEVVLVGECAEAMDESGSWIVGFGGSAAAWPLGIRDREACNDIISMYELQSCFFFIAPTTVEDFTAV